jgi:hypothetical protein
VPPRIDEQDSNVNREVVWMIFDDRMTEIGTFITGSGCNILKVIPG